MKARRRHYDLENEETSIDISPLIDIVFILVIFVVVVVVVVVGRGPPIDSLTGLRPLTSSLSLAWRNARSD